MYATWLPPKSCMGEEGWYAIDGVKRNYAVDPFDQFPSLPWKEHRKKKMGAGVKIFFDNRHRIASYIIIYGPFENEDAAIRFARSRED